MRTVRKRQIEQFVKYCLVGVLNTLVTFGVIYICKSFLSMNIYLSNVLGYVCGVTNSFLCNRNWVFRSRGRYRRQAVRFLIGFGLCYLLQFAVVWSLASSPFGDRLWTYGSVTVSGYGVATVIGNVVYTLANFCYNKIVAFR